MRPPRPAKPRRKVQWALIAVVVVMAAGVVLAWLATQQTSTPMLVAAGLLLVAGIAGVVVLALQRLRDPLPKAVAIIGSIALGAGVFLPASLSVADRCGHFGDGAELSACDLSGEDLAGKDLQRADFTGADLTEANLAGANLEEAIFTDATLRRATLTGARLTGAVATDADLESADLSEAVLAGVDLTGATIDGVVLSDADLTGAVLAGADLTGATIDGVVLSQADLSDAVLSGAPLMEVALDGADLSGADLSGADLTGATLVGATLQGTQLADARLPDATLDNANLGTADLSGADLRGVRATSANFEGAVLTGTQLGPNDFIGAAGLTDEALSAALGVPATGLAGATAERGIQFDRFEDIVSAAAVVVDGGTVAEARAYVASGDFHPAIVFDAIEDPTTPVLAESVQGAWAPTGLRWAELVVVVRPQTWQSIEVCPYFWSDGSPAPPVTRYVSQVTVTVLASHDGAVVAEQGFRGTDPRACQATESASLTELRGEPPDLGAVVPPWLAPVINPPA